MKTHLTKENFEHIEVPHHRFFQLIYTNLALSADLLASSDKILDVKLFIEKLISCGVLVNKNSRKHLLRL